MTFLEYCCEQLLGPAVTCNGERSTWHCPRHEDNRPSFSTRLPHPRYRDRFQCWSCGWWGDEHDLLIELRPELSYPDRCRLLADWRIKFERQPRLASSFSSRGSGTIATDVYKHDPRDDEFSEEADKAIEQLLEYIADPPSDKALWEMLKLAQRTLEICAEFGLHPLGLAGRCHFEVWTRKMTAEHMAECNDPNCEWYCCRLARGWTEKAIDAANERWKKKRDRAKAGRVRGRKWSRVLPQHLPQKAPPADSLLNLESIHPKPRTTV